MTSEELVNVFAKLRPNATFLSIKEYKNNYNEVSNFGIVFHVNYEDTLKRSYEIASSYRSEGILFKEAKRLVLSSLADRINACKVPIEERDEPYIYFKDADGKYIKGIKAHQDTGGLYLFGLLVSKEILVPAEYDAINKSLLTRAKERIERITPVSKFRQFKLVPKSYREIVVENISIK